VSGRVEAADQRTCQLTGRIEALRHLRGRDPGQLQGIYPSSRAGGDGGSQFNVARVLA
jgi:hypothetical protein